MYGNAELPSKEHLVDEELGGTTVPSNFGDTILNEDRTIIKLTGILQNMNVSLADIETIKTTALKVKFLDRYNMELFAVASIYKGNVSSKDLQKFLDKYKEFDPIDIIRYIDFVREL